MPALMGKLLPYNITGDVNVNGIGTLKIVSVPHDRYLSPDQVRRLSGLGPPIVEADPVAIENEPPAEPDSSNITSFSGATTMRRRPRSLPVRSVCSATSYGAPSDFSS